LAWAANPASMYLWQTENLLKITAYGLGGHWLPGDHLDTGFVYCRNSYPFPLDKKNLPFLAFHQIHQNWWSIQVNSR
jgi:hypothetical protein